MAESNNVVSLRDQKEGLNMSGEKPIFYTVEELYEKYPAIKKRCWDNDDFGVWIDQDIIIGRRREDNPTIVEVEKESVEAFLEYHTNHILNRNKRVEAGLENLKKPVTKK